MNFDEMDIEPNSELPAGRKSSPDTFAKESRNHDDEPKWRQDSMSKYHHSESNYSKVDNLMDDISKGQPLPPGMEDEITGPCQILKSLDTFEHPLIGLEFLLELHNIVELKEPRYLCLLCDKRGDPRTILVHLTSQNHYLMYLRKYFRKFYSLIDKLPKSNECRGSVTSVTSHLIAKLEEKYGRLQPTATREDVVNVPEQRSMILQKIDGSVHFSESAEDAFLEDMLTIEYVQNPQLLQKNFPLKPKHVSEKPKEESKSLFNKISRNPSKKNIRNNRENNRNSREESPDVVFVGASRKPLSRNGRSRERSPRRMREMSLRRSRDRSPHRSREISLRRSRERSPFRGAERLPLRSRERSPLRGVNRSPLRGIDRSPLRGIDRSPLRGVDRSRSPVRGVDRSPLRGIDRSPLRGIDRSPLRGIDRSPLRGMDRSPLRGVERSPIRGVDRSPLRSRERSLLRGKERSPVLRPRSRSHHRSPSPDRGRRRFISPSYYRSLRYQLSRSRSPQRHRSRSPNMERERFHRRSPSPMGHMRGRERSPMSSRYGGHRYRSPERSEREIRRVIVQRSPSPMSRGSDHAARYRGRSRSRERSPHLRARRSRSRSRPRHEFDTNSGAKSLPVDGHSKSKEKGRADLNMNRAYIREAKEVEEKLNRDMEGYTETPESHPAYQDEWKKFWCAKFKEIQSEGKEDPHKYDYKPEWITFWNIRVKELFDEDLKSKITALKSKYGISGEEKEPKSVEPKKTSSATNSPGGGDEKKPVIDIKTMWKELTGCDIKDAPANAKRRSLSPWEDNDDATSDKEPASKKEETKKEGNVVALDDGSAQAISPVSLSSISDTESPRRNPYSSSRTRSRSRSRSRSGQRSSSFREYPFKDEYRKPASKKIHFENPLNIITVLRQLSVLEFQLGSYASHVISLLTSGLTMERIKPQSSIDLLTKDNILFLELVKEKLKGQLLAGVVPKSMVKATLFCIKNTEELLQLVPKLKATSPPPIPAPPPGLLYGAGVDPSAGAPGGALAYGSHVYAHNYGGYNRPPFKHFNRKERYAYRKPSPKRDDGKSDRGRRLSDEFPFRNNEPAAEQKPAMAVDEEIPIDKNLIALQIAEVLTQQGRSDVSNEELQALINTVVENLKQEQKMKAQQNVNQLKDITIPAVMNAISANAAAPPNLGNVVAAAAAALTVPTIPAGFNLNDVSSSTLALLQDAYANASVLSANQSSAIEDLSEADLIQMLRNFKSIPRVKQEKLIEYLRKLEVTSPERVEELKKYVNVL